MPEKMRKDINMKSEKSISTKLMEYGFDISKWERETLEWDRSVGKIVYIKQIHNDYKDPDALELYEPEKYNALIDYQKRIYGELAQRKIYDIFLEWIEESQVWEVLENWKEKMRIYMNNPVSRNRIFAHFWWWLVYAIENKSVIIHATESKEIIQKIETYNTLFKHDSIPEDLIKEREDNTIGKIHSFLEKNPWKPVILIFGWLHNFQDNIESIFNKKPIQEIISFNELAEKYIKSKNKKYNPLQ